ncbi:MAG TPA: hypothetical protein VJU82_07415 [Acidobacteriaceae bacterium]|nr:hypothetical protein [Acidobacteriaceae bacterium]
MISWRQLPWKLLWWLSPRENIDGIQLGIAADRHDPTAVVDAVKAALTLIRETDPHAYARVRGYLRGILVTEQSGGSFLFELEYCRLGVDLVLRGNPLALAMTIVHEVAHAELFASGLAHRPEAREQEERYCVNREIQFARQVAGSEEEIAVATALLDTRWWEQARMEATTIEELRRLGCPDWLIRLFKRA